MRRTHVVVHVEYLSLGPRCLFPMFELLRHLSYISILHIFPLHEDYGQDGADDDDDDDDDDSLFIDLLHRYSQTQHPFFLSIPDAYQYPASEKFSGRLIRGDA